MCVNERGEITHCLSNALKMLGYHEGELLGRHYTCLFAGSGEPARGAVESGAAERLETQLYQTSSEQLIHHKDGSQFLAKLTITQPDPNSGNRGQNIKAVLVIQVLHKCSDANTADRPDSMKQLETLDSSNQSLLQSNFDLMQFAYVASHDLQEPLRTITGFCDLITTKNKGKLTAETERYLNIISSNIDRMQRLIDDLLQYAKLDAPDVSTSAVSLHRPLRQAIAALDSAIKTSGAQITYDELPVVAGNSTQLSLLFQNLLGNAIKFRSTLPPSIHISCKTSEGKHHVSVRDQGIGLEMRDADRIFSLLQRLHPRDQYEGSGIGLALCKRIAQRHGATISVNSSVGEGCTFTVVFDELVTPDSPEHE